MTNKNNQQILIGGAIVFRDYRGKRQFLVTKQKEAEGWGIPKIIVRRGESSVRAVIRMMGEQAGITARVLEEAGRSVGSTVLNGKPVSQKFYYYLMLQRFASGEAMGLFDNIWLEYDKASKKIETKKEKDMFRDAKAVLREWEKNHKNYKEEEEEALALEESSLAAA